MSPDKEAQAGSSRAEDPKDLGMDVKERKCIFFKKGKGNRLINVAI